MNIEFSLLGALAGLILAIFLIVRKTPPPYALLAGALIGGLIGGGTLNATIEVMVNGAQSMTPTILRILASGVLDGALIKTGSAAKIADGIAGRLTGAVALAAIAFAAMVVTAVGVFADIAVVTVAPIALAVGRRVKMSVPALLVAMVGGSKAGNVISPNPNTLSISQVFNFELTTVIAANIIPAIIGIVAATLIAYFVSKRHKVASGNSDNGALPASAMTLPSLSSAVAGPLVVLILLALRPLCGISVDPLIALSLGGVVSVISCGEWRKLPEYTAFGLAQVAGVCILLLCTGTIAGIIKASSLNSEIVSFISLCHLPVNIVAPLSGILMAGATASAAAGASIAADSFSGLLLSSDLEPLAVAATMHAGCTVLDSLPHGSFFHATAGAVGMSFRERLAVLPFGALVGLIVTIVSYIVHYHL